MELEELNHPKIVSERLFERMTNEERRGLDWLTQILSESTTPELRYLLDGGVDFLNVPRLFCRGDVYSAIPFTQVPIWGI